MAEAGCNKPLHFTTKLLFTTAEVHCSTSVQGEKGRILIGSIRPSLRFLSPPRDVAVDKNIHNGKGSGPSSFHLGPPPSTRPLAKAIEFFNFFSPLPRLPPASSGGKLNHLSLVFFPPPSSFSSPPKRDKLGSKVSLSLFNSRERGIDGMAQKSVGDLTDQMDFNGQERALD